MFKKNDKIIKVISIRGSKTATVQTVASVSRGVVTIVDSGLTYEDKTGREIDPAMAFAGITSEIIPFDDGEIEKWFAG